MSEAGSTGGFRVAFLTPEYPTELVGEGGVGSYVHKMAHLLAGQGHDCTVFVPSTTSEKRVVDGIELVRVARPTGVLMRALSWVLRRFDPANGYLPAQIAAARRMARALAEEHAAAPFDVVQSANLRLVGMFVGRRSDRRHLVRISTSRLLYDPAYGRRTTLLARLTERLDVGVLRRADVAYAPSRLLQSYFRDRYGVDVALARPPVPGDVDRRAEKPDGLPERYLVHFGALGSRKGTDVVAAALARAWQDEPDLRMVWVGPLGATAMEGHRELWGERADQVVHLGARPKDVLYAVVAGAIASVLPSRMDNLPNTVIESLTLGVPVIGSDGASIDELVVDGRSGLLVPIGDSEALARAMVSVWRGEARFTAVDLPEELDPARAITAFFELAGLTSGTGLV